MELARLAAPAEACSESDLPWRVNIVDWYSAGEPFRRIIARDRVPLQEAPGDDDSQPAVAHGTAGP
jgi:type I restriction enzyme S subunit